MTKPLCLLMCVLCLTNCAGSPGKAVQPVVRTEFVQVEVPLRLTDCQTEVPADIGVWGDFKAWVVRQSARLAECQAKAAAVRDLVAVPDAGQPAHD